jgi:hypothetical protein
LIRNLDGAALLSTTCDGQQDREAIRYLMRVDSRPAQRA